MRFLVRRVLSHPVSLVLVGVFGTLAVIASPFIFTYVVIFGSCEQSAPQFRSPGSSQYTAQIIGHNCGATTTSRTEVVVSKQSSTFPYRDKKQIVFEAMMAPHGVALRWDSDTHLIIEYPTVDQARIRVAVPAWRDVTITHQVAPR